MNEREIVDPIIDVASGQRFYGIEGRIVSESEALANYGDNGRGAYGVDPVAAYAVAFIDKLDPIPAIVNTDRTRYTILPGPPRPTPREGEPCH